VQCRSYNNFLDLNDHFRTLNFSGKNNGKAYFAAAVNYGRKMLAKFTTPLQYSIPQVFNEQLSRP